MLLSFSLFLTGRCISTVLQDEHEWWTGLGFSGDQKEEANKFTSELRTSHAWAVVRSLRLLTPSGRCAVAVEG